MPSPSSSASTHPTFPTIDISPFLHPTTTPPSTLLSTATSLSTACTSPGFFYLTNHNIPSELCDRILNLTRSFFLTTPPSAKQKLLRKDPGVGDGDGARGYQLIGDNVTEGKRDWHEAVDFYREVRVGEPFPSSSSSTGGRDVVNGDGGGGREKRQPPYELLQGMNQWPEGWRDTYEEYIEKMLVLGEAVVRAMGWALEGEGGDRERFVRETRRSWWVVRGIGYPSLGTKGEERVNGGMEGEGVNGDMKGEGERDGDGVSCGAHSDYGCVTLLLSDGTKGALQAWVVDDDNEANGEGGGNGIKEERGRWVDVDPIEGALVVNIGDMMARWSGGKWKATRHRVVHKGEGYRVSVPFFFEPDWDARVPGGEGEGEVVYGEYLSGKVRGNF